MDESTSSVVTLTVSADELDMIIGSIDNAIQFIEKNEYSTVMGYAKPEVRPLLERLVAIRTRHDTAS